MELVYQIFILFLIQSSLLVQTYYMLDLSPQRSKSHVNLETEFATEYPYLQHYTLISTYIPTLKGKNNTMRQKRHMLNTNKECHYLSLLINATTHTFCIFEENLVESDVAKKGTKVIVHGSGNTQTYSLEDLNITVARGYDVAETDAGSVDGYIEDYRFFGRVFVGSNTYYLEPVKKFPSIWKKLNKSRDNTVFGKAILYEPKDAAFQSAFAANVDRVRLGTIDTNMPSSGSIVNITHPIHLPVKPFSHHMFGGPQVVRGAPARLCDLVLTADFAFFSRHAASVSSTVRELLRLMGDADAIYRAADMDSDGSPDNLGLAVVAVVVLTSRDNPLAGRFANTEEYLRTFSAWTWNEDFCLAVAFTHRNFGDGTLGASWLGNAQETPPGGICQKPVYLVDGDGNHQPEPANFNTVMVATRMRGGDDLPVLMSVLNIVHEIAHSFGSLHDDIHRNEMMCDPDDKYLMSAFSLWGDRVNNYHFSTCSRRRMVRILKAKGACLRTERHAEAFCGNGLIEGDEECGCGLPLDCLQRDPCCNPRGSYRQCRVKKKFPCHPSQGPCCLPTCQFRDLSHVGLNCAQERAQCPCKGGSSHCSCGLLGECVGSQCLSAECVRLGLRECTCMSSTAGVCSTCCQAPSGECSNVVELTRQQVLQGVVSVASIRRLKPTPGGRLERVCDDSGDCANASFREWQRGNFCVSHGKLGHCSKLDVCDITRHRGAAFPRFEKIVKSRAAFCTPTTFFGLCLISLILFTL